jgi:chromosome segregation protein
VRLKSVTLKGFKSFPGRTRLDFGPGVSVVVGPNGSGKSNVTDAVLWAMGEQSPLAVRGQSMQDVIFGGGKGVQARSSAEVEIVLDNSDGTVELPLGEISIARRLDRSGEGSYRLNGARCRLSDVIEVLSDTGLGKEQHSVISQGRVDAIVTSRPRDRRLLIEEAAGLGKHRKRRRRAQLKLERTQENLDRALDVEREARTRLRPLKRQAEAAELHERLERQILEARLELARDAWRGRSAELAAAEERAGEARHARAELEAKLTATVERRGIAERALAERTERHDALARSAYDARSARERLQLRAEQVAGSAAALVRRVERVERELAALAGGAGGPGEAPASGAIEDRIGELRAKLAEIESHREQETRREVAELDGDREQQLARVEELERGLTDARAARERAEAGAEAARERLAAADRELQDARRESARVGAELAAANQFLRGHVSPELSEGARSSRAAALSEQLRVRDGYELALAAALGGRLDAAVVEDVAGAQALLDTAGPDGGMALLADLGGGAGAEPSRARGAEPVAGAQPLLDLLSGPADVLALAERLLGDAWVVERLEDLPRDFSGVAATRGGRVWFAAWGEVRQLTEGGTERVLARRNERDRLIEQTERCAQAEREASASSEHALEQLRAAEEARSGAEAALREAERVQADAAEQRRRIERLIEQRRSAPAEGPLAVRKAELEGELGAELRQSERLSRERAEREARGERLRAQHAADRATIPLAERLGAILTSAGEAVSQRVAAVEEQLRRDRAAGEEVAGELRACAEREAEIQSALRQAGERVTDEEVAAQRLRDQAEEAQLELRGIAERLGMPAPAGPHDAMADEDPVAPQREHAEAVEGEHAEVVDGEHAEAPEPEQALDQEQVEALLARVERLRRRREQLGPVNPLAQEEYREALAHVEELESRRTDLETALRELNGVIRETDRQIQATFEETFGAAARNFEELVGDVFPGGSGRLRLVAEERAPRPVLGGQPLPDGDSADAESEEAADAELQREEEEELLGVEIEITPAGKETKRLSLLSGGEKSMTALAFLFAVFLARPCPFYILDEVEAALDDINLDRFLALLRRYSDRAQFIVITHQKRTMEAADWLYGVSMGGDGVSKVLSRRLPGEEAAPEVAEVA